MPSPLRSAGSPRRDGCRAPRAPRRCRAEMSARDGGRALGGGWQRTGGFTAQPGAPSARVISGWRTAADHTGTRRGDFYWFRSVTGCAREPCGADRRPRPALGPLGTHGEGTPRGDGLGTCAGLQQGIHGVAGRMCTRSERTGCRRMCSVCLRAPGCPRPRSRDPAQKRTPSPTAWFSLPQSPTRLGRAEMPAQLRALCQTSLCPQQPVPEMGTGRGQLF